MHLTLSDFLDIGREQYYLPTSWPVRLFSRLFGAKGIYPKIRNGYVVKTIGQMKLPETASILDAGSGRGLSLFWLAKRHPGFKLHGIEFEQNFVIESQQVAATLGLRNLTFTQGDLTKCDFGGPYDLIFSIDVLEHIEDDIGVLCKMQQALTPGGKLLLHLPLRHQIQRRIFPVFKKHTVDVHVRDEYTPEEIREKLENTGFVVQRLTYGIGLMGELAVELNMLFWDQPLLRGGIALASYPLALPLAYGDVRREHDRGNSLIILAEKATGR